MRESSQLVRGLATAALPLSALVERVALRTRIVGLAREILALPSVTVRMVGDDFCRSIYEMCTAAHPRYKLIQRKKWGVALLPLPDSFDDYLKGKAQDSLRKHRNRCVRLGFRFAKVNALERIDEILAINRSMPERQGRPISPEYLDVDALRRFFGDRQDCYGVLDDCGVLKAYMDVPVVGDVALIARLLGHSDALDKHVMYLGITEIIRELSERKKRDGRPKWLMYDILFGAHAGLRHFKERLGFRPYTVRWVWVP
jgi:hypothetical protein